MNINDDTLMSTVERWESTGLLHGLPFVEKTEMAMIFDNAARLILSKNAVDKIPDTVYNILNDVTYPTLRRLYRRVGVDFDITSMMSELIVKIEEEKETLVKKPTPEENHVVEFCIKFADNYEDEKTSQNRLNDEEYAERIDKTLTKMREILLNKNFISRVDKDTPDWEIKFSEEKKSENATRLWNQKVAMEFLRATLTDTNRGE